MALGRTLHHSSNSTAGTVYGYHFVCPTTAHWSNANFNRTTPDRAALQTIFTLKFLHNSVIKTTGPFIYVLFLENCPTGHTILLLSQETEKNVLCLSLPSFHLPFSVATLSSDVVGGGGKKATYYSLLGLVTRQSWNKTPVIEEIMKNPDEFLFCFVFIFL